MENYDCPEREESCPVEAPANNARRRFLQGAAVAASGLVLGMQMTARADDEAPAADAAGVQLALPEKVLEAVGGFEVVENGDDKIIVARTGPTSIAACSAICTHRGGTLNYDAASGQFVCPRHGARFETTGKVAEGPAKADLQSYQARPMLTLSVNPEAAQ